MKDEAAPMPKHGIHFLLFLIVCLFVHFLGGGGGGKSELPFILSKTGFGYGGAKCMKMPPKSIFDTQGSAVIGK